MSGYQEILTDPSYSQQMVTLTYPHVGNTGCNDPDQESAGTQAAGFIIRDLPLEHSNWQATQSLGEYLTDNGCVAIAQIDTRALTRKLRDKGSMNGCIMTGAQANEADAIAKAQGFPGLKGMDLAKVVSTQAPYDWSEGVWDLDSQQAPQSEGRWHVVAYDFGIKRNILRMLAQRGCRITVVPAQTPAQTVLDLNPDGVFLSNGPGDPEPCTYAIEAIQVLLDQNLPMFGICLGHQLMALASGATTEKMKFGHHGANHPVQDLDSQAVMITSQNHGFSVDEASLPSNLIPTHRSLFDGSLQGVRRTDCPAFGFQGHPEASPGPHDIDGLFDQFISEIDQAKQNAAAGSGA